jgi:hypothetical protein
MILGTAGRYASLRTPEAVDLSKGYDGLFVKQGLARDPLSGELYLFVNAAGSRRRRAMRVLSVLTEPEPVRRILEHLGMPADPIPLARARDPTVEADDTTWTDERA